MKPDEVKNKEIKRTASYCGSAEQSRAADIRDAFGITGGCGIKIGDRGLRSGDSERGNVFRLCNLELFQNNVALFDEQGETSGITWPTLCQ